MKKVPKKNIEPVLVDVRKPDFNYKNSTKFSNLDLAKSILEKKEKKDFGIVKSSAVILASALILFTGFAIFDLNQTRQLINEKSDSLVANVVSSLNLIKDLNPSQAKNNLEVNSQDLLAISSDLEKGPSGFFIGTASKIFPLFKDAGNALKSFTKVNLGLLELSSRVEDLQLNGFGYFVNNGNLLIKNIEGVQKLVLGLQEELESLKNNSKSIDSFGSFGGINETIETGYISYGTDLYLLDDFLGGLLNILSSEKQERVLLIFQNSSEIRPAGGFMGSYGELIIKDGHMDELKVEDIYWPDHPMNLEEKLIPPKPLQHVTTDWGARDANWFFDFPTSAETVMNILEMSNVYKDELITFRGAIGIDVNVLGSLLEITGPIEIEDYDLVIDSENFLAELQREIETGRDAVPGSNPKTILSVITPKIMDKLNNLNASESRLLLELITDHFENKDIMIHFRDNEISKALKKFEIDGSVYAIPNGFWGGYLAVVNSNIAGGKTDAFIDQEIDLRVEVSSDGSFISDLIITRTHNGSDQLDPWYRADNRNYMKIFTNGNSSVLLVDGNEGRERVKNDYALLGDYKTLEVLENIERTEVNLQSYDMWNSKEFGKSVYGTWFNVSVGEKEELNFRYLVPSENNLELEEGREFRFVIDKQSGVDSSLSIKIGAPLGFEWRESNSSNFTYQGDLKKREVIKLTLVKN